MKTLLFIFLSFSVSVQATSQLCDLFESEALAGLTDLSVPNCLTEENLFQESESSPSPGPICNQCRNAFNARISIPNDDRLKLKKQAYFDSMYSEFEKAMSTLAVDMVSIRTLYSTGSNFQSSASKCSTNAFEAKVSRCGTIQQDFFKNKHFSDRMASEISNLLTGGPSYSPSILQRGANQNQCNITDQNLISLKPLLLEKTITPEQVSFLAGINATNTNDLMRMINAPNKRDLFDLVWHHPLLRSMAENPTEFKSFFSSLTSIRDQQSLKDKFKADLYTQARGNKIDRETAQRCEQAMNTMINKVCSSDFDNGNLSLGPFKGFDRYNNGNVTNETEAITSESDLAKNVTLLEFCEAPRPQGLLLARDAESINSWMPLNHREMTFRSYSSQKYSDEFGTPKSAVCSYHPADTCTENNQQCELYKLYRDSVTPGTPEYRLASNPDKKVNEVLRALVGTPKDISQEVRRNLVEQGILPQSNGQFVERPQIPERQPEYLAGVANGTITPNVSGSPSTQSQASNSPRRNTQAQAQPQLAQPGQGNSAVSETQIAANSEDDSETLRRFEQGLDDRLRRVEGQQPRGAARSAQPARRQASRPDSSSRTNDRTQSAEFIPTQTDAPSQISGVVSPATAVAEARLGQDTSRRGLADRQRNDALASMNGARTNPSATSEAGRNPASEEVPFRPEASLTLNIESGANLERVLASNENLKALIQEQRPFRFRLNNNVFDVQFKNGSYSVSFRSGANSGRTFATTLQDLFNNSMRRSPSADRNATLEGLGNTLRN